jgi:hypothetical protein
MSRQYSRIVDLLIVPIIYLPLYFLICLQASKMGLGPHHPGHYGFLPYAAAAAAAAHAAHHSSEASSGQQPPPAHMGIPPYQLDPKSNPLGKS